MRTRLPALLFAVSAAGMGCSEAAPHPGAAIYQKQCVECHGAEGEGNELEEVDALYGDRSVSSLARLIERTMPEEDPKLCTGEDAQAVAEYIYNAFYSLAARERLGRLNVARIETVRLTVPQYRNALADIFGQLAPPAPATFEPGGLRGYYFRSKGMNKKEGKAVEKIDPALEFDFGEGGPAEGIGAEQFSIVWEGSFFARDTGHYEFRTSTPNGVRLYINTPIRAGERNYRDDSSVGKTALIDDWVSSGKEVRQSTAKVYLLGGRRYPIRLDYFKYKEKIGKVRLEWKPPHGAWSTLSGDALSPTVAPRTFVVTAPFPPDDRSLGYERGSSLSKAWHEGTTAGAVEAAEEVDTRLGELARLGKDAADPAKKKQKLKEFCLRFAEIAFRRPLADAERQLFVERQFAATEDPEVAAKRCVILCLKSPRFLYPELHSPGEAPDGHTVASRLSFALWDSVPDRELRRAAAAGQLKTPEQVVAQARRLLADPRARAKTAGFFEHWLEMEERDLAKDKTMFPQFDEAVVADLRESLLRFVDGVVWGERSDYRELLNEGDLLLNRRLAKIYGGDVDGDGFQPVKMGGSRAGVLTHPYLLSAFAYHNNTSPIHRGVFLTRNIVGRALKPPPMAVAFKDDEFDPDLTMREKVTQLTRDTACMSCHSVINPLGFSLENFDAVGRWRSEDNNKPVDPKSEYVTAEGKTVSLSSARDVASFAAGNAAAHRAFVAAMFHHMVKQPVAAYGPGALGDLRERFAGSSFNIRELMVEIARVHALHN